MQKDRDKIPTNGPNSRWHIDRSWREKRTEHVVRVYQLLRLREKNRSIPEETH